MLSSEDGEPGLVQVQCTQTGNLCLQTLVSANSCMFTSSALHASLAVGGGGGRLHGQGPCNRPTCAAGMGWQITAKTRGDYNHS